MDIYDGLDNGLTVPGRLIVSCCLASSFVEFVLLRVGASKTTVRFKFTLSWCKYVFMCFSSYLF